MLASSHTLLHISASLSDLPLAAQCSWPRLVLRSPAASALPFRPRSRVLAVHQWNKKSPTLGFVLLDLAQAVTAAGIVLSCSLTVHLLFQYVDPLFLGVPVISRLLSLFYSLLLSSFFIRIHSWFPLLLFLVLVS